MNYRLTGKNKIQKSSDIQVLSHCALKQSRSSNAFNRRFVSRLAKLSHAKFDIKVSSIYKTFKRGAYFQLKSRTPLLLYSNVVYKFTCSCDSILTYTGKSTLHLSTRVGEHLNVASQHKHSAIKQRIPVLEYSSTVLVLEYNSSTIF